MIGIIYKQAGAEMGNAQPDLNLRLNGGLLESSSLELGLFNVLGFPHVFNQLLFSAYRLW